MYKAIALALISIVLLFSLNILSSCGDDETSPKETVKDIDGNVYTLVTIGSQVWMVENLKVTRYKNGEVIPLIGLSDNSWETLTTGAYSNDYAGTNKNGRLYNWYATNDVRGLAPEGWHIPTLAEWTTLTTFLGGEGVAGSKLKQKGTANWCSPNSDATNATGFTALPGDWRIDFGIVTGCGDSPFWTATEESVDESHNIFLFDGSGEVSFVYNSKYVGWGVRCIKD